VEVKENRIYLFNKKYFYNKYIKKKKNGKIRRIYAPSEELKKIQKDFSTYFYKINKDIFDENKYITGFLPERSIITNASMHLNKDWVINLDIKDFFPNTKEKYIKNIINKMPKKRFFFIKKDKLVFNNLKEKELLDILCLNGGLPQGSPASPILANYVALKFVDPIIQDVLSRVKLDNLSFSRYADDITISFNGGTRKDALDIAKKITKRIKKTPYQIKKEKTKIKHKSQSQIVTGIIVNGSQTRINKKTINTMRAILYNLFKENKKADEKIIGMLKFIESVNKDQYNKLIKNIGEREWKLLK